MTTLATTINKISTILCRYLANKGLGPHLEQWHLTEKTSVQMAHFIMDEPQVNPAPKAASKI
jgi:hypothetical protein